MLKSHVRRRRAGDLTAREQLSPSSLAGRLVSVTTRNVSLRICSLGTWHFLCKEVL